MLGLALLRLTLELHLHNKCNVGLSVSVQHCAIILSHVNSYLTQTLSQHTNLLMHRRL